MSFGFLGIQMGWGLQMANMSAIYEYLGAKPDQIPLLWLAAPLTGLIVQPFIGNMSDHTWGRLGRRRPYFLIGAILSSLSLVLMPQCSALWMAAGLLWILDASINISMEPFRAFVADKLPGSQVAKGFAMQSFLIGVGTTIASALPWILSHLLAPAQEISASIPRNIRISFYLGSAVFLGAVLWTIVTTDEYPPEDLDQFKRKKEANRGLLKQCAGIYDSLINMPRAMRQLAVVQFFTWLGLFCMWLYFPVAVAHNVFGAENELSPLYHQGVEWAGVCFSMYSVVTFAVSFLLPVTAKRIGLRATHAVCLLMGAAGLISTAFIHEPNFLLISMIGVGTAWASILSMPYAMLATTLPEEKMGLYMGIFNFFIVIPEILSALTLGWFMKNMLHNDRLSAVILGGVFFVVAALMSFRVKTAEERASESAKKLTNRLKDLAQVGN